MSEKKSYTVGDTVYVIPGKKGLPMVNPETRDRYIIGEPQKAVISEWLKVQLDAGCLIEVDKPTSNPQQVSFGKELKSEVKGDKPKKKVAKRTSKKA